ncbi:MAG: c-type cytochrome domain-containing protein, partial [Oleiharenicola lentus]
MTLSSHAAEPAKAPRAKAPALAKEGNPAALSAEDLQFFETKIRPLLTDHCYNCHSHTATKIKAGLLLDSREGVRRGGDSGPAIVPGKPNDSLLIQAIRYTDADLKMPPEDHGGQLTAVETAALTEWVRRGAPDPRVSVSVAGGKDYGPASKNHWSFQSLKKPAVPAVKDKAWVQSPI